MRKIVKEKKKSRGKVHVDKDIFFPWPTCRVATFEALSTICWITSIYIYRYVSIDSG